MFLWSPKDINIDHYRVDPVWRTIAVRIMSSPSLFVVATACSCCIVGCGSGMAFERLCVLSSPESCLQIPGAAPVMLC